MALARVHIERERADFVRSLRQGKDLSEVFPNYATLLAFAAALGFKQGKRIPIDRPSRKDPDSVPQDQFAEKLRLMDLIAVLDSGDASILAKDDESRNRRAVIFQEYANAGFEFLEEHLKGTGDKLNQLILLMQLERQETVLDEKALDFLQL